MAAGLTKPPQCFNPIDFNVAAIRFAALFETGARKFGRATIILQGSHLPDLFLLLSIATSFIDGTKSPLDCDAGAMPDSGQPGLKLGMRGLDGKAVTGTELIDLAVLDELIRPADANDRDAEA